MAESASPYVPFIVIPAKAGIHLDLTTDGNGKLDPGFRRDDD